MATKRRHAPQVKKPRDSAKSPKPKKEQGRERISRPQQITLASVGEQEHLALEVEGPCLLRLALNEYVPAALCDIVLSYVFPSPGTLFCLSHPYQSIGRKAQCRMVYRVLYCFYSFYRRLPQVVVESLCVCNNTLPPYNRETIRKCGHTSAAALHPFFHLDMTKQLNETDFPYDKNIASDLHDLSAGVFSAGDRAADSELLGRAYRLLHDIFLSYKFPVGFEMVNFEPRLARVPRGTPRLAKVVQRIEEGNGVALLRVELERAKIALQEERANRRLRLHGN